MKGAGAPGTGIRARVARHPDFEGDLENGPCPSPALIDDFSKMLVDTIPLFWFSKGVSPLARFYSILPSLGCQALK